MKLLKDVFMNMNKRNTILLSLCFIFALTIFVGGTVYGIVSKANKEPTNSLATNSPTKEVTKEPTTTAPTATPVVTPTVDPHIGKARSRLTGEWVDKAVAANRPYAVMFNNLKVASPQSGISQADILMEAVVEGGITRLMGVFGSVTTDRLGSLRSARPYFVDFAKDFDAIYIHEGGSTAAKSKIIDLGVADLDGTKGIGNTLIYRDSSINAPHNAFTSTERIEKSVSLKGYRMDYQGKDENFFGFNDEDTDIVNGKGASKVEIRFSGYTTPVMVYGPENKLYYRRQFLSAHTDRNTGKQLAFKNVIIMYVVQWSLDSKDRQAMDISNSTGSGIYMTNGKATDITWTRNGSASQTLFKDKSGQILKINPGKTYIAVVPTKEKANTTITK